MSTTTSAALSRDLVPDAASSDSAPRLRRLLLRLPKPVLWVLGSIWHWWLHRLASRGWTRDFAIPIAVTIAARFLATLAQHQRLAPLGDDAFTEAVFDISVLIAAMMFTRWSITWGVPAMMSHVRDIAANTQEPKREFLRDFATAQIRSTRDIVGGLTGTGYPVVNPTAMRPWFARFFSNGGGAYIGVDSHRPAEYMTQYEWYLDAHADSLEERDYPKTDRRVLATSRGDLSKDWRHARPDYQGFYRWHQDHDVTVTWVDIAVANKLRSLYGIGNADVCLWRNFAVMFEPDPSTGSTKLGMWFPGESEREGTTYEKISAFVTEIQSEATPLEKVAPGLDLVTRELADEWIHYVEPEAREQGGVGRFLTETLAGRRSVFDAAAGIACDSVLLMRQNFQVFPNEVDELLAHQAEEYASSQDVRLNFMSVLWEDLPDHLPGNLRFDAILCLGNSLCLVDDAAGRLQCLTAFRDSLEGDGMLVIDERNFQLMLDNARSINFDPVTEFKATTQGDVMYRGLKIRGYPAKVDKGARVVHWRFFRNSPAISDRGELDDRRLRGSDLVLHAFSHGELFSLLKSAGFSEIDVYADLQQIATSASAMPDRTEVGNADFITYVARKSTGVVYPARFVRPDTPSAPGA